MLRILVYRPLGSMIGVCMYAMSRIEERILETPVPCKNKNKKEVYGLTPFAGRPIFGGYVCKYRHACSFMHSSSRL